MDDETNGRLTPNRASGTISCRAKVADDCLDGQRWHDPDGDQREDGTYRDGTIICDACYVTLMPKTPSGSGLTHELDAAISAIGRGASGHPAVRPRAVRQAVTFADLCEGDFMTAEEGDSARWVRITAVGAYPPRTEGAVVVTFKTPEPIGTNDSFVIERPPEEPVTIDQAARRE